MFFKLLLVRANVELRNISIVGAQIQYDYENTPSDVKRMLPYVQKLQKRYISCIINTDIQYITKTFNNTVSPPAKFLEECVYSAYLLLDLSKKQSLRIKRYLSRDKVKKYSLFSIFRSLNLNQACILVLDIEKCPAKIELCPTKAASQLTQLPAVNLKQFFKIC